MIDKVQKIREEVERLKSQLLRGACSSQIAMETRCKEDAYNDVLTILDSMQEESVSEELENQSKKYSDSWYCSSLKELNGTGCGCIGVKEAFIAGTNWQKQQMLEKSFGATVCKYLNVYLKEMDKDAISKALRGYTNGDRVRVLIIK